jgi:hypothetical protein
MLPALFEAEHCAPHEAAHSEPRKDVTMRLFPKAVRTFTAVFLIAYSCILHVAPAAAGLAASRVSGITAIASTRDADMISVGRALENKVVAQKLLDYGVRADEVQLRLASMSDQDLHTLASTSRGLPSGGDGTTGAIIGILVVVILVIVVLRLMNRQVVVR